MYKEMIEREKAEREAASEEPRRVLNRPWPTVSQ